MHRMSGALPSPRCSPMRFASLVVAVISLASLSPEAGAQRPALRGVVLDATDGSRVASALVATLGATEGTQSLTDESGHFWLRLGNGAPRIVVARLGFRPETLAVTGDSIIVRLRRAPLSLSASIVRAERGGTTASSGAIRELDLRLRPRDSSQEILRLVPGLVIAQHAGGGKAEQIFMRGFDADHGTDVALSVDGLPVNMVTHAHGQGYADLHFVMPEVVEGLDVRKGPFDPRDGDFATAGAVALRTRDRVHRSLAIRRGSFGHTEATALLPFSIDERFGSGYAALGAGRSDGPFIAKQDFDRVNAFAKWISPTRRGHVLELSTSAYDADWSASGQIPARAVQAGLIDRFGAIDSTEGGATSRYDVRLGVRSVAKGTRRWDAMAWATRYRFDLRSNFTFFLNDSVGGDAIGQRDARWITGVNTTVSDLGRLAGIPVSWTLGAGVRGDDGTISLGRLAVGSERISDASFAQQHGYLWGQQSMDLHDRVHLSLGLRADRLRFDVNERVAGDGGPPRVSVRDAMRVSPKANATIDLSESFTMFASTGAGFHSNDGRSAVRSGVTAEILPRALGTELGVRHTGDRASVAASLWRLDLASELVYVGDEGTTEAGGRSRRVGVDLEARVQLTRQLWFDGDLNLARARFRDLPEGENLVPLAPRRTASAGLTLRDAGPYEASLRVRHLGSRTADESGSVTAFGHTLWELSATRTFGPLRALVAVDNLFGVVWNEAQFATTSRLLGESAPTTELHFTPGYPRRLQVGMELRW
jgi:hypothetical protein